jgi:hypothetical protein
MYVNKALLEAVSGFDAFSDDYWSSTEDDGNDAWVQNFEYGFQYNFYKDYTYFVRAVRAF